MSLAEDDVRTFISGTANTFSLLHAVLEEDEALARDLLSAFVEGDEARVEAALAQATIAMEYGRVAGDGYRLSFRIGRLSASLEIREAAAATESA